MSYELFGDAGKAFQENTPFVSQPINIYKHFKQEDFSSVAADIADLGMTGFLTWADPLGALVGAGVGFLVDFVKPLSDMLTWVTGDSGAISEHRQDWQQVGKDLIKLADEMAKSMQADLAEWSGPASIAAKQRLDEFIQGTRYTAAEIGNITSVLAFSGALMDAAMSTIKDLISQFVEWLIVTWLAAQAAAIPSLGASEAAASAATVGEAAVATSRGARILQKVMSILRKLQEIISRIATRLGALKNTSLWRLTGKGGNNALGPRGLGHGLVENGRKARDALRGADGHRLPFREIYDWKAPTAGGVNKVVGGLSQSGEDDPSQLPSGDELNRMLNPLRPPDPPPQIVPAPPE